MRGDGFLDKDGYRIIPVKCHAAYMKGIRNV